MEVETYPADFISIHAPVKGATPRLGRGHRAGHDFNPRSREGSDPGPKLAQRILIISIHAPVKGATQLIQEIVGHSSISIHAPVKGATLIVGIKPFLEIFQSTLP